MGKSKNFEPLKYSKAKIKPVVKVAKNENKKDPEINQSKRGIEKTIAIEVPRVPDNTLANVIPRIQHKRVVNFSNLFEFRQSEKQKMVTPNIAVEKGIGLPENIVSRPTKYFLRP